MNNRAADEQVARDSCGKSVETKLRSGAVRYLICVFPVI